MKWYKNEVVRGQEDYTLADSMMQPAEENEILVKGHTVLWNNQIWLPSWDQTITDPEDLKNTTINRINYYEDMLGKNAPAMFYSLASNIDPDVPLFVNEYNTVEFAGEGDGSSSSG
ncbi:unnamed protein product [Microthlaspi erraticum]|uniref:GH10 domain-containing protein n=1 Tax=Microthlaspi erraticum TaxID=1685480 RepID=A0A6D2IQH2_9BRAS|nr:unnamed protein product [Microthlaspi erraticum]